MTDPNTTPHPCEAQPLEPMPTMDGGDGGRMYSVQAEWFWRRGKWRVNHDEVHIIARLRAALHAKDAECEMLKDALHLAEGTMRLAIKHRDAAEAERLKATGWRDAGEVPSMTWVWGWWRGGDGLDDWCCESKYDSKRDEWQMKGSSVWYGSHHVRGWQPLPAPPKEATVGEQIIDDGKFVGFEPCERGDWVKWSAIQTTGVKEADDANQD